MNSKYTKQIVCWCLAAGAFLSGCDNLDESIPTERTLQIDVNVGALRSSRNVILSNCFSSGQQIGVSLYAPDGKAYQGSSADYTNICFTAADSTSARAWKSDKQMNVSRAGKAVAYFPYSPTANGTSISVETASQTDYMYSGWSDALRYEANRALFSMKHALSAFCIKVIRSKTTSSTPQRITSLSIQSAGLATGAMLDITSGVLSDIRGANTEISIETTFTLDKPGASHCAYLTAVPVPDICDKVIIKAVVDGSPYTVTVPMTEAFAQGTLYNAEIILSDAPAATASMNITPWNCPLPINQ